MLEEEVLRLEDQVVHFRQGLYQEAVYISSSKRNMETSADLYDPYPITYSKQKQSKISVQTERSSVTPTLRHLPSVPGNTFTWQTDFSCHLSLIAKCLDWTSTWEEKTETIESALFYFQMTDEGKRISHVLILQSTNDHQV